MKRIINLFAVLLLCLCAGAPACGQTGAYKYHRSLEGISGQWHKVTLPDEVFGKVRSDLSDIRIFGITATGDTIEAPYLLQLSTGKTVSKEATFRIFNATHNEKGHYFTFEVPASDPVNRISLDFRQSNFDWRVQLEGSNNQHDWFTVADNYRIVSVKNEQTDFRFTQLDFPETQYRFYRLRINTREKPELTAVSITRYETAPKMLRSYPTQEIRIKEDKQARHTEIMVTLPQPVPVSHIRIAAANDWDYYRPVTIRYMTDSVQTEKGWQYNYATLLSGTLNSIEDNDWACSSTILQRLKIEILNQSNRPLIIDSIYVGGYIHDLVARFTEGAEYFLAYGNPGATMPHYDISRFADKIPAEITTLRLEAEQVHPGITSPIAEPLFRNKAWLWGIMIIIIFLLGWFSLKMIRKV